MRGWERFAAVAAFAAILAGCGGGGSSSTPTAQKVASSATSAPTGAPLATASLTIKFPSGFHKAKIGTTAAAKAKRAPAYVNPSNGLNIDVFVDGTDETPGLTVSNTSDGTQTVAVPLYSTTAHTIVAVETNNGGLPGGNILALGEEDIPVNDFSPGGAIAIGLTMAMSVQSIGLMTDPADANNDASIGSPFNSVYINGCGPGSQSNVYGFAADASGGFTVGEGTNQGNGPPIPTLVGFTDDAGTSPPDLVGPASSTPTLGYTITFNDGSTGGVTLNLAVTNPIYTIVNDANTYYSSPGTGSYPGIERLYNSSTLPLYTTTNLPTITTSIDVPDQCSG